MAATIGYSQYGHMFWRGRWIILACVIACVGIASVLLATEKPTYRTQIRVQMLGDLASPEARKSIYEDFVRWRSRSMPPPAAPAGVAISEAYNPVSEGATLTFTLPAAQQGFAQDYYDGLTRSLEGYTKAKLAADEQRLTILADLTATLDLQGSDYIAQQASNIRFAIEDTRQHGAIATITAPPAPRRAGTSSLAISLAFAAIVGLCTGVLLILCRILVAGRAGAS